MEVRFQLCISDFIVKLVLFKIWGIWLFLLKLYWSYLINNYNSGSVMIIIDSIGTELLLNKRNCYYWHEYFISFKKKFIWTEYVKSLIIFFNNQHRQSSLFNTPPQKLPSKVTADALTSNILISPLLYPSHITWSRVLTVHVSWRVSHARGAMFTTHYLRSRLSQTLTSPSLPPVTINTVSMTRNRMINYTYFSLYNTFIIHYLHSNAW